MFSQDPLTCRPLLSELNVSLLLLNMVTRPPWSQNCLSWQRSVAGHAARRAAPPRMARSRRQTGAGVFISSSGWWRTENWHEIRRYREKCTDHGTRAATQMLTTVTQHHIVWERVTLLPESGLASKNLNIPWQIFLPRHFSHIQEIINYIFVGLLFCNLYINIVNNYRWGLISSIGRNAVFELYKLQTSNLSATRDAVAIRSI